MLYKILETKLPTPMPPEHPSLSSSSNLKCLISCPYRLRLLCLQRNALQMLLEFPLLISQVSQLLSCQIKLCSIYIYNNPSTELVYMLGVGGHNFQIYTKFHSKLFMDQMVHRNCPGVLLFHSKPQIPNLKSWMVLNDKLG